MTSRDLDPYDWADGGIFDDPIPEPDPRPNARPYTEPIGPPTKPHGFWAEDYRINPRTGRLQRINPGAADFGWWGPKAEPDTPGMHDSQPHA